MVPLWKATLSWFSLAALNESIVQFDSENSIPSSRVVCNVAWGARYQLALKVAVMMFFLSELWKNKRSDLPVIIFHVMAAKSSRFNKQFQNKSYFLSFSHLKFMEKIRL